MRVGDGELLEQAAAGDREAAAALVTRHADRVVRFAHALCENPTDADDVAQEAMLTALREIGRVRSAAALPSWLYAVTRTAAGRLRRTQRPSVELGDEQSAEPRPDDDAGRRELSGTLTQALRGLDPKYRDVVWLRDVEGLTAPEVAEALELDVAAVKTRLHRARAALREQLDRESEGARGAACPDIVERFSSYLEGEIGPTECAALQSHVETCASCNAACTALRRTVSSCHTHRGEVSELTAERVRAALAAAIGARESIANLTGSYDRRTS